MSETFPNNAENPTPQDQRTDRKFVSFIAQVRTASTHFNLAVKNAVNAFIWFTTWLSEAPS